MRKGLTTLLVILLAVGAMLVSCKAEVGTPADELVSASFELDSSRALSATLEPFSPNAYYWKYAASKNEADTSGLHSGETAGYDISPEAREDGALWVKTGTQGPAKGLAGYKVPDFSQGLWDFTLYAYKDAEGTKRAYLGEATAVTLVKGGTNMVHVVVSPSPTGTGTLYIGTTTLTPHTSGDVPSVSRFLKVEDLDGHEYTPTTGTTYKLDAGAYKVTVTYKASGIVYAEGTVMATIYPNMTTTVSGSVDELVTYAQFVAEQNPDIIARTAEVKNITAGDEEESYTLNDTIVGVQAKVSAVVPGDAARKLLTDETADANASMALALNVDTTDSTSTSVTYDISMTKIITLNSEVSTSAVKNLGTYTEETVVKKYYAIATVQLSKNLTGVKVTHSGHDMKESTDTKDDEGYGVFFYDATTGILTIQTNTFSPFKVTYDGETAGVAEVNGVKYATLAEAVEKAPAGATVKLLSDAEGAGMSLNKSITIDLNEHTYTGTKDPAGSTGTKSQLFQLLQASGSVTITNGTLRSVAGSGILMLVQNYCDLTLEDVILDGSNIGAGGYTLSNNCGNVSIKGKTAIYAPTNGRAFDVCGYSTYSAGVAVNVATTGTISGKIEIDEGNKGYPLSLNISNGTFLGSIVGTAKTSTEEMKEIISITGGVYNYNPSAYVAEGCEVRYNETTKLWTVMSPGEIARELAIKAGADPATIFVGYDSAEKMYYALGTLTDMVRYCFYTNKSVYVYNAKDYNGWDGKSFDKTKYTVGKLIDVDGLLQGSFSSNSTVTTIAFSKNLSYAYKPFEGNTVLSTIDFTNLTLIPARMFYKAYGISDVSIPSSVTYIGSGAFSQSNATSIVVEAPVVNIEETAFAYCPNLKTIDIKGAAAIGTDGKNNFVARACPSLTEIYIRDAGTTFIGNKSMTFTHEESGNDAGAGITLYVVNETVFNAMKEFSGDYIYSKMKVVYAN